MIAAQRERGEPTFPVGTWREVGFQVVAIDGPCWCARNVLQDLVAARFTPTVLLGLEARPAAGSYGGSLRVASCGHLDAPQEQEPASLKAWRATHGQAPTWFEALGRDAAQLTHDATALLPGKTFTDMGAVMQVRTVIQQVLLQAEAPLWTTKARGFGGRWVLTRKVQFVVPPKYD